jgi:hypothetical protein
MLILKNYTISNNKEKIKSATIEEGDDIVVIAFFVAGQHFSKKKEEGAA